MKEVSTISPPRATAPLERIHSDICGPMNTTSLGGAKYFVTFIDDYSRYGWTYFLKKKSDLASTFEGWANTVSNLLDRPIKILHSDNGGEYLSKRFEAILLTRGITHERTAPYTPQHNGVAERRNRTLVELARSMIHHASLDDSFWAEAVAYATTINNCAPTKSLSNITPYEAWNHKLPSVAHFRVFGCRALALIQDSDIGKFASKTKETIYLGPSTFSSGHRLWDRKTKQVVVNRNVHFFEDTKSSPIISMTNTSVPPLFSSPLMWEQIFLSRPLLQFLAPPRSSRWQPRSSQSHGTTAASPESLWSLVQCPLPPPRIQCSSALHSLAQ